MRFKRIYIEITNICNLKCEFCLPHHRNLKWMSFEEFKIILAKVKPYSNYIYLHVKGEPLLHPDIEKFIVYAFEQGFLINLTTNGTLLDKYIHLAPYLRQINISLHATNDLAIVKTAQKIQDCIVNFRVWNFEENHEAISLLENEFNVSIENVSNFKLRDNIFVSAQNKFQWPDMQNSVISTSGYCHALKDQIAILVDGTVVPCCLDNNGDIPLGNIFKDIFEDILSSEKVNTILTGFQKRICTEELCQKCEFKNKF